MDPTAQARRSARGLRWHQGNAMVPELARATTASVKCGPLACLIGLKLHHAPDLWRLLLDSCANQRAVEAETSETLNFVHRDTIIALKLVLRQAVPCAQCVKMSMPATIGTLTTSQRCIYKKQTVDGFAVVDYV